MLASAREPLKKEPQIVASMVQSAMTGMSQRILTSSAPQREFSVLREELIFLVTAYLEACSAPANIPQTFVR
jgi:hypothetical protein